MAEMRACVESHQAEKCHDPDEETQQVTDSSQGRVVTSSGKLRPVTVLSIESGYNEDTSETEQPIQVINEMKEKMKTLCGSLDEEVTQMAVRIHNEGKREGRSEALEEVEQQRLAFNQIQAELMADILKRMENMQHRLSSVKLVVCGEVLEEVEQQRLAFNQIQAEMADNIKMMHRLSSVKLVVCGEALKGSSQLPGPITMHESIMVRQLSSVTRQSSGDSFTSPKEETAGRKKPGTESSSVEPVSPTSTCSRDTLFNSADEMKTVPLLNASSRQGSSQSSSDEERRCRTNGLELHPRKMLASRKKKGKK